MPQINYPYTQPYLSSPSGLTPLMQVKLINGTVSTGALGTVDSGSTVTVFKPEHANLLGIEDVTSGDLQQITTQGGGVDCYVFNLEMQVEFGDDTIRFPCRIGFFVGNMPRNILGRNVLFQHFQIGFNDRNQEIYLLPEEEN
jgi:hypothetical protein